MSEIYKEILGNQSLKKSQGRTRLGPFLLRNNHSVRSIGLEGKWLLHLEGLLSLPHQRENNSILNMVLIIVNNGN